jgi:hypothetical protein
MMETQLGWSLIVTRFTVPRACAHAEELGIHFLFIPPGLIDEFQPLDRSVFGALKAACRRRRGLHYRSNPFCLRHKKIAAAFLIRAWEGISMEVLDEAWARCDPGLEQDVCASSIHLLIGQSHKFHESRMNISKTIHQ